MRSYRFARFLAWILVVAGLAGAVLFPLAALFGPILLVPTNLVLTTPFAVGGLVVALAGFAFMAWFDVAAALVESRRRPA